MVVFMSAISLNYEADALAEVKLSVENCHVCVSSVVARGAGSVAMEWIE